MTVLSLLNLATVLHLCISLAIADLTPTVHDFVRNITYIGTGAVAGVEKFLNIPYGKDTSEERRFMSLEPHHLPSGTVYDATMEGPVCPQVKSGGFVYFTNLTDSDLSEDCLRLKVARPVGVKEGEILPVMVWIYGGGLYNGHINERTNEPDALVLQSVANGLPVVFVAMNYRLNIFGFAFSEVLRQSNDLNVGLKDQRLALDWVQENIHIFGGDPDRVTIFGEGSGAIMESIALEPTSARNLTFDAFNKIANMTGCNDSGDPQGLETLQCLRQLPMETLLNATIAENDATSAETGGDIYLPKVDSDFLPSPPSELIRQGMFVPMPVIIGWTQDDSSLFTPGTLTTREFLGAFFPDFSETIVRQLLDLIFRDLMFSCPSLFFGNAIAEKLSDSDDDRNYNENKTIAPPIFVYEINQTIHTPILESIGLSGLGVIHTSELPYVFANFTPYNLTGAIRPTTSDFALLTQVSRSWSTFANVGVPSLPDNDSALQSWEPSFRSGETALDASLYVIGGSHAGMSKLEGEGSVEAVAMQKLKERCGFLDRNGLIDLILDVL
ncbi:alpha/beta-hydrolase [Dendrothele bispora CBS 962.96]|uniref:Alpha/beta-hydrolase n=1 Tax=Dendrothele bispora (strain CBS 962.96) TaxID=1314807 RepID=A0A4S8MDR9_DENBC|nr:alpha/beta-hydrolase [Dendrothele bispora CBS 962.96]